MAKPQRTNKAETRKPAAKPLKLGDEFRKLDASIDEEIDALKVDLAQDNERPESRDGSGLIVDELAEAEVAKFTETGSLDDNRGAESLVPGRENTGTVLRRHHPNTATARAENVVEGNLDEPQDEIRTDPDVDQGTAA